MLESKFQAEVLWLLRKMGCLCAKQKERSLPDYLVVTPGGGYIWIEFKSSIGKTNKLQAHRIYKLRSMGAAVYVLSPKTTVDVLQLMRIVSLYSAPNKKLFLSEVIDLLYETEFESTTWGSPLKTFLLDTANLLPQGMRRLGIKHLLLSLWEL